jgi:uncharacterized membrane protein YoaK (UPF0700 family)
MDVFDLLGGVGDILHVVNAWRLFLCLAVGVVVAALVVKAGESTEPAVAAATVIALLATCAGAAWEWRSRHAAW